MFFSVIINLIFFFCKSFKCRKFINSNSSCINVSYSALPPFNFYLYTITILHSRLRNLYMHRIFFTLYPLQKVYSDGQILFTISYLINLPIWKIRTGFTLFFVILCSCIEPFFMIWKPYFIGKIVPAIPLLIRIVENGFCDFPCFSK